jgi:radical SAM superfamily enzyme YgiQ (UPF0313 family)
MLKVIKKGETMAAIEDAIRNACELGYEIKLFFIFGNPSETWDDVEDMVRLSRKYPIQEVHFNYIIPYPGTELYDWIKENNYFLRQPNEYLNNASAWENRPIFETPELLKAERMRLFRYLHKVRIEIHRKAIRRILRRHQFIGKIASLVLANGYLEQLYYKNTLFRRVVESFRYRIARQAGT